MEPTTTNPTTGVTYFGMPMSDLINLAIFLIIIGIISNLGAILLAQKFSRG